MFLSAQSFANLKGKALFCSFPYLATDNKLLIMGKLVIEFKESNLYDKWVIYRDGDDYIVPRSGLTEKYKRDANFIFLEYSKLKLRISRKTLEVDGDMQGQCELTQTFNQSFIRLHAIKGELQKRYDAKREGNKI